MKAKIGINGLGRIGRMVLRSIFEENHKQLKVNHINNKTDILVFVESKKKDILKRLKTRNNFNKKLYRNFKNIQLPLRYKKNKSNFIIKNDFTNKSVKRKIKNILNQIIK